MLVDSGHLSVETKQRRGGGRLKHISQMLSEMIQADFGEETELFIWHSKAGFCSRTVVTLERF